MIVITGAKGFIGSQMVKLLNNEGYQNLILVDESLNNSKSSNLIGLHFKEFIDRKLFLNWFKINAQTIDFVFHLGARTDTTEQNVALFNELNLDYSKEIFTLCTTYKIPLIYASSAATYGNGELGYDDTIESEKLNALNPYGQSKLDFDKWVETQKDTPPFWAGLKFFNVYGPNEHHKGRMASVIFHAYNQIKNTGTMKLFQSHKEGVNHGDQMRDFIYVKDVVNICLYFFKNQQHSGIYNVGTGKARSFNDLVNAVFFALNKKPIIEYVPTPIDIREAYQYYTEAKIDKLRLAHYPNAFYSLEDGVNDYVKNHLDFESK